MTQPNEDVSILAGVPNPFQATVSTDAWKPEVDVEAINAKAFGHIWSAFEAVADGPGSRALLIPGPKGSGKTHLLGRFRARLAADGMDAPDRVLRAIFVYLRLDTNPERLWQHVRQRLAQDLLRRQEGLSQLQRLVAHELAAAHGEPPSRWVMQLRVLIRMQDAEISSFLADVEDRAELGRELRTVIEHLMFDRHRSDAKAWLRGDYLPPDTLKRLGLNPEGGATDDPENSAKQVVQALLRLAFHSLPVALCFDQVESLQRFSQDTDALFRFGRVAAEIVDGAPNVLMLTCLQSSFLDEFASAVRKADQDRIAPRKAELELLTGAAGRRLARALLQARMDGEPRLAQLRADRDGLWPLDDGALDGLMAGDSIGARTLLSRAATEFDRRRNIIKPPTKIEELLAEELDKRITDAERKELDLDATLGHGLPLFLGLGTTDWKIAPEQTPKDILVRLKRGDDLLDVAVINQVDARSLWRPLDRLGKAFDPTMAGLCILREAGRTISPTANKTRQGYDELIERGAKVVHPTAAALAVLEAVRSLLSDARAGDLAPAGNPVEAAFLATWLAEQHAELGELPAFIEALTEPSGVVPEPDLERVRVLVTERRVVALSEAAKVLNLDAAAVRSLAEGDPDALGVIHGEPAALFAVRSGQVDLKVQEVEQ